MVTKVITDYVRSWIILFLSNTLNIQLVANLMHHLLKLPLDFFEKRHIGDIVSRFGSITTIQEKLSTDFIVGIVDGIMIFITLMIMLTYSGTLTVVVLGALFLYIFVRVILYPPMKYRTQESIVTSAKEQMIFMESVRAILPLKIFGGETQRENVWQNCYTDKLNSNIALSKLNLIYTLLMQLIFGLEHIIVIFLGARLIMNSNEFSVGMLVAYLSYRQQFVSKTQNMVEKIVEYQMIKIHLERVADIALTTREKNVNENTASNYAIRGNLQVQNLSYQYSEHEPYIFRDLNFNIKAGEILAIVGPSGCGKTTLIKVLLSLLLPSSGKILIDGIDINKIELSIYRSQIAAVMQEDSLLSGSIAENISFFDPKPDFEHIYNCAMAAAIHEDIINMTMSYQSLVGDMGTSLSGGQKQRILLARALYARPKILFLDEATSNLDLENESIINTNIRQIGITRIIISHRKEIMNIADQVINFYKLDT